LKFNSNNHSKKAESTKIYIKKFTQQHISFLFFLNEKMNEFCVEEEENEWRKINEDDWFALLNYSYIELLTLNYFRQFIVDDWNAKNRFHLQFLKYAKFIVNLHKNTK
jgi:hypothetical protein